jgi:hypothetical protein
MPNYIVYNPASTPVAGRVTRFLQSFPEEREAELGANILKDPDITGITLNAAKVVGGVLSNLTAPELASIDADVLAATKTALKTVAKGIFVTPDSPEHQAIKLGFEALAEIMVSEINILRAAVVPALTARTGTQVKNAFKAAYETKVDAL